MTHIEFTGVGGVGKSTLRNKLIMENKYVYSGLDLDNNIRTNSLIGNTVINGLFNNKKIFKKGYWKMLSEIYYRKFVENNTGYKDAINDCVKIVMDEKELIFNRLKDTAQKYQYGIDTKQEYEILSLDEGFYHRAASVGVRTGCFRKIAQYEIPPSTYFDTIPQPDLLFNIKANKKTIQNRKNKRDGDIYSIVQLEKIRDLISRLCIEAKKRGVKVVIIENNCDLNKAVEAVEKHTVKIS